MDYGRILSRAWNITWTHKFLIVLGLLVALGSGIGSGTSSGINYSLDREGGGHQLEPMALDVFPDPGALTGSTIPVGLIVVISLLVLAVAAIVWAVSTIARGGLVSGVGTIDSGGTSSFGEAWTAISHVLFDFAGLGGRIYIASR